MANSRISSNFRVFPTFLTLPVQSRGGTETCSGGRDGGELPNGHTREGQRLHREGKTPCIVSLLLAVIGSVASVRPLGAQTIENPRTVEFDPSPDHGAMIEGTPLVDRYEMDFFVQETGQPVHTLSLGKPAPAGDGRIRIDFVALLTQPLPTGTIYTASIAAVGPRGRASSIVAPDTFIFTAPCSFAVSPTQLSIAAAGGNASISVTTTGDCAWTSSESSSWLSITSGSKGSGSGSVTIAATGNDGLAPHDDGHGCRTKRRGDSARRDSRSPDERPHCAPRRCGLRHQKASDQKASLRRPACPAARLLNVHVENGRPHLSGALHLHPYAIAAGFRKRIRHLDPAFDRGGVSAVIDGSVRSKFLERRHRDAARRMKMREDAMVVARNDDVRGHAHVGFHGHDPAADITNGEREHIFLFSHEWRCTPGPYQMRAVTEIDRRRAGGRLANEK